MKETTKAIEKLRELIYVVGYLGEDWLQQKEVLKHIIQGHINNAYMIDQRYYKEYINLYTDMLLELIEL